MRNEIENLEYKWKTFKTSAISYACGAIESLARISPEETLDAQYSYRPMIAASDALANAKLMLKAMDEIAKELRKLKEAS